VLFGIFVFPFAIEKLKEKKINIQGSIKCFYGCGTLFIALKERHKPIVDISANKCNNKIKLMTSINRLHVSAQGCHPEGLFLVKGIQVQQVNLSMCRPHWND
jgi:hypothetical protein